MKKYLPLLTRLLLYPLLILLITGLLSFRVKDHTISLRDKSLPASSYSSDVLDKWMAMQIKLMSTTIASFNGPFVRIYSYSGLAAYAAIAAGIPESSSNSFSVEPLNQIPVLPVTEKNEKYHWPSSLNAALAYMNRAMFPSTNDKNLAAIDSLESMLNTIFSREIDPETAERSMAFGKKIAEAIYQWAESDGYRNASNPYTPPAGRGKWEPTPPNYAKAVTPWWGSLRSMITGSIEKTQPSDPPVYDEDPASDFYKMNKELYDADQQITSGQRDIVQFWKDINPGITAPGHWLNVLRQVFQNENEKVRLDKAAFVYALTGMALNDAWISCWKTRYHYNLLRPVTYIRRVMGHKDWLPLLPTPPHPEYSSGFAAMAGAVTGVLSSVFGDQYKITDHTYDQFGMGPRSFDSFRSMAEEAGNSKFYGGIHYKLSVDVGLWQGREVAKNIVNTLLNK